MAKLLPTTRAQVSGHKFMRRRMEHGLIFGDIRMIHDPLAARRRATIFGTAAVAMIAGVMGLFAWMRPNADPGDAPIFRAADGTLYVRVGEAAHPVTNLASARLIAGEAAEPARIGDARLAALPRGVPVGIVTAPGMFAPKDAPEASWSVCGVDTITVVAGEAPEPLPADAAVLAADTTREWLVTSEGRRLLPDAATPEGRVMRRALGIGPDTPRWSPPPQVIGALKELPPAALPAPLPGIINAEGQSWALLSGRIQPITPTQREILLDAGARSSTAARAELAAYPDGAEDLRLPSERPRWVEPHRACVDQGRGGAFVDEVPEGTELSGTSVATHFAGLEHGSVGVDSGHGYHVVSANGLRHSAPDAAVLETVGATHVEHVPWEIIALLPEGAELTRDAALTATY